jgi:hypothetical protein
MKISTFGQKLPSQGALTGALTGAPLTLDAQELKIDFFVFLFLAFLKIIKKVR